MTWLNNTYYSLLNFRSKNFSKFGLSGKNSNKLSKNRSIRSANCAKFAPIINLFVLCFRHLPRQRTLWNSSELHKFHANSPTKSAKFAHFVNLFYIMFQAPAPAENSQEFQQIMQIPHNSPTQSTNYAKFAPFANIIHYVSDA